MFVFERRIRRGKAKAHRWGEELQFSEVIMPLLQKCRGCPYLGPDFKEHFRNVHVERLATKEEVNVVANKYMEIMSTGESQPQISLRCSSCSALCSSAKSFIEHIEENHLEVSGFLLFVSTKPYQNSHCVCPLFSDFPSNVESAEIPSKRKRTSGNMATTYTGKLC